MQEYFSSIRVFALGFAAIAVVLIIAGCGGGNGPEAAANSEPIAIETGSLSKAEFVDRANEICEKDKGEFLAEYQSLLKNAETSSGELNTEQLVNDAFVPTYEKLIGEISDLGSPPGDEETITKLLRTLQSELDLARRHPSKAFDSLSPLPRAVKAAEAYGLEGCAGSFGG